MRPLLVTRRPGLSLIELIVALALFTIILTAALGFYRQQGIAFTKGNERSAVMQNLRYALNTLEQEIRTAGIGVPFQQPVIVYAGENVLAFNADYASNLENDFFAVYSDRRFPAGAVSALTKARRITIPTTQFAYPDTSYFAGSGNSPAETIIFFFVPDSASERTDEFVLYRQVNDMAPDVVARGLLRTEHPFFTYYVLDHGRSGAPLVEVPNQFLPAAHTVAIHGSPADTGLVAGVDSARAVRVSFGAVHRARGETEAVRTVSRLIRLRNMGLDAPRTCGNRPILGRPVSAIAIQPSGSEAGYVRLEWAAAVDEVTGEQDVMRYVIWRSTSETAPWGDPLASVAAGSETYVYEDRAAEPGIRYWYALAAQDCTPQFSDMSTAGPTTELNEPPS
jgi:prepilin-type N-terminal cleavage/methylation domain-containing protein